MLKNVEKLLEEKKYKELQVELNNLNSSDVAELLEDIDSKEIIKIFRLMNKDKAAEVFTYLPVDQETEVISLLSDKEAVSILDEMFTDDAVDLLGEMPSNVVKRILRNIKQSDRNVINELLKFPEDSAGSIMTTEMVELKRHMTVEEAFKIIKETGIRKETIYICYIDVVFNILLIVFI